MAREYSKRSAFEKAAADLERVDKSIGRLEKRLEFHLDALRKMDEVKDELEWRRKQREMLAAHPALQAKARKPDADPDMDSKKPEDDTSW